MSQEQSLFGLDLEEETIWVREEAAVMILARLPILIGN